MKWRARSTRLAFAMPTISSGKATLSITVRQGKVDSSWNTMPIDLCGPEMVSPATLTTPSWSLSSPPMTLNRVDLPQPDGPITERNSPGLTLKRDVVDRGERTVRRLEALDDVVHHEDGVVAPPAAAAARVSR